MVGNRFRCLQTAGALLIGLNATQVQSAGPAATVQPVVSSKASTLLDAETRRLQAQVSRDVDAVGSGLADELIFTHASGQTETKAEFLDDIRKNRIPFKSIETSDRYANVIGNCGYIHGTQHLLVGTSAQYALADTYLAVYIKRDGRWQMVAWEGTQVRKPGSGLPPPAPAPDTVKQP